MLDILKEFKKFWIPSLLIGAIAGYFLALGSLLVLFILSIVFLWIVFPMPYGQGFYALIVVVSFFLGFLVMAIIVGTIPFAIPFPSFKINWSWFFR